MNAGRIMALNDIAITSYVNAMRKFAYPVLTLFLTVLACEKDGGNLNTSEITYGFSGQDIALSIARTSGGYFISGYTTSIRNQQDMYVAKLNSKFEVLWSKSFGGAYNDQASRVVADADGGCVVVGTIAIDPSNTQIVAFKTDAEGNILWYADFGGPDRDEGRSIVRLADGSFAIAGSTYKGPSLNDDIFLAKISASGQTLWSSTYGDVNIEKGQALAQTADGGFVVAGYRSFVAAPNTEWNVLLAKFDEGGNPTWEATFNNWPIDQALSVCSTQDGGILIGAQTEIRGLGADVDNWLIKTDASGNTLWTLFISSTREDRLQSVYEMSNGNILVGGMVNPAGTNIQASISMVSATGQLQWTSTFGSPRSDVINSVIEGPHQRIIGAGYTQRSGTSDIYIILPDNQGHLE